MSRWIAAGVLLLAVVVAVVVAVARLGRDPDSLAAVRANALELARENGEPAPSGLRIVATRERAAVAALSGAQVASNRDVYAVTMRGTFVGRRASRISRGTAPPRGTVLVAAFDALTLELVFWGLRDREPALPARAAAATMSG